jgi:nitrate reductase NapAB chaperone NapD
MPLCSYLVIPEAGRGEQVAVRLASLSGCSVERAQNRELLILLTETEDASQEGELRRSLGQVEGVQSMVLTFGKVDASDVTRAGAPTL